MKRQLGVLVLAVVAAVMAWAATAQAAALHGRALANRLSGVHHGAASTLLAVAVVAVVAVVVCAAVYASAADRGRAATRGRVARLSRYGTSAGRRDKAA